MAASPKWKVFDANGTYQAACKEIEAAACLLTLYGDGASIRFDHRKTSTVFVQGEDGDAGESYDQVATFAEAKERTIHCAGVRAAYGADAAEMLRKLGLTE